LFHLEHKTSATKHNQFDNNNIKNCSLKTTKPRKWFPNFKKQQKQGEILTITDPTPEEKITDTQIKSIKRVPPEFHQQQKNKKSQKKKIEKLRAFCKMKIFGNKIKLSTRSDIYIEE
jgi:hypothetical protein